MREWCGYRRRECDSELGHSAPNILEAVKRDVQSQRHGLNHLGTHDVSLGHFKLLFSSCSLRIESMTQNLKLTTRNSQLPLLGST